MNINKALKTKSKLIKEIKQLNQRIQANNSYIEGNTPPYDSAKLLKELEKKIAELIELKVAINKANVPIFGKLTEMTELKLQIVNIKSLNCIEGSHSRYGADPQKSIASITEIQKDSYVNTLENRIETLQDEIDMFNATTSI